DHPGSVSESVYRGNRRLDRQPSLPDSRWPQQRDQVMALEQPVEVCNISLAADEGVTADREVVAGAPQAQISGQRRELSSVLRSEFGEERRHVALHRAHRYVEPVGDLP